MANKKAKKGKGKARVATKPGAPKQVTQAKPEESKAKAQPDRQSPDLDALRKPVFAAKGELTKVEAEAKELIERGHGLVVESKRAYREAVAAYREACRKLGVQCEFEGGRSTNVSAKVSFIVEKTDKGVRVAVKGKPESEELIPLATLKTSVGKAAYAYVEAHVGPRERVGNKGGTLANRLRAVMAGK